MKAVQRYIIPADRSHHLFSMTSDLIRTIEFSPRRGDHISFFAEFYPDAQARPRKFVAVLTDEAVDDKWIYRGTALPRTHDNKFWSLFEIPVRWQERGK